MSIPVTSDSSQRRYDKPLLAVLASLALHAAVVAPFLLRLPETTAEAPVEPSVTVEIVPEPEPQPPQPEATKAEKAPRSPAAASKPESASTPLPPGATPAPAEPPPPAAPSQPFEASAAAEPDAPPDPVEMPPPDGEAKQADTVPPEPVGAPSTSPAQADKPDTVPSTTAKAPVAETTPGAAVLPAPAPEQTETPSAVPEILAGTTMSGEGQGEAVTPVSPKSAVEPPSAEQEQQPPREIPPRAMDSKIPEEMPTTPTPEGSDTSPMTPREQAAYVPATPAIPQAKPTPAPAPKPAKTLYAKNILADPRVRGALDKLPPEARLVQICSIEASEQARHSSAAFVPEIIKGFGRNGGVISGQHLSARGGAVRSRGVWREITFECTVNATFDTITAFRFALGGAIPRSAWASRRLPAD
ncbi:uncharacterized protein DUF930 [Rhizobium sp. PP-F2F-G20b]|nr:uncharacterized protein DUF930 [Rhizobium sp. PP-F2F-G20b]